MLRLALGAAAYLFFGGCDTTSRPNGAERFMQMSPERRENAFAALPVDRQIALYLELMRTVKPRPVELGVRIAMGGRKNAVVVAEAARRSGDARDKHNLIQILSSMRNMRIYDSCDDPLIRTRILPERYQMYRSGSHKWLLEYSLELIDLCLRQPQTSTIKSVPGDPVGDMADRGKEKS